MPRVWKVRGYIVKRVGGHLDRISSILYHLCMFFCQELNGVLCLCIWATCKKVIVKRKHLSINKISLYWKWTWRGSPNWVNSVLSNLCMWLYDYFSFWVHLFAIHLSLKWNWLDKYFTCNFAKQSSDHFISKIN